MTQAPGVFRDGARTGRATVGQVILGHTGDDANQRLPGLRRQRAEAYQHSQAEAPAHAMPARNQPR